MVIFKEKASIVSEAFSILALVLSESFLGSVGRSKTRHSRTGDDWNTKTTALKDGDDSLNEVGKFRFVVVETKLHSIDAGTM